MHKSRLAKKRKQREEKLDYRLYRTKIRTLKTHQEMTMKSQVPLAADHVNGDLHRERKVLIRGAGPVKTVKVAKVMLAQMINTKDKMTKTCQKERKMMELGTYRVNLK